MKKSVINSQNMTFQQLKAFCLFFSAEQKIPQENNTTKKGRTVSMR